MSCATNTKLAIAVDALESIATLPLPIEQMTVDQLKRLILANQIEAQSALDQLQGMGAPCAVK